MARGQLQAPGMPQVKNSLQSKAGDLKSFRREKGAGGSSPLARWSSLRATRPSIQASRRKATRFAIGRTPLSGGALRLCVVPSLSERREFIKPQFLQDP